MFSVSMCHTMVSLNLASCHGDDFCVFDVFCGSGVLSVLFSSNHSLSRTRPLHVAVIVVVLSNTF